LHIAVKIPTLSWVEGNVRHRRRDAQVNRDSLLEAALTALVRDPSAGLDAVAATAGLSRRTVYGHFRSREDLVAAIAERAGDQVADAVRLVRATTPQDEAPLTTLARLEVALWRRIERYRLLGTLATRPEHRDRVLRHAGDVRTLRVQLVEAARACGSLRPGLPAEVVARLIQPVPLAVFDAVLDGTLQARDAARAAALTALAVAGADASDAEKHVRAALAETELAETDLAETPLGLADTALETS